MDFNKANEIYALFNAAQKTFTEEADISDS